jgi:hypothetical protein
MFVVIHFNRSIDAEKFWKRGTPGLTVLAEDEIETEIQAAAPVPPDKRNSNGFSENRKA